MKPPYNPIDVANYIAWKANELGKPVTHLKLQKLLYYVVAKYFKENEEYLITQPICKWQLGPVVKEVYHAFKLHGSEEITMPYSYLTENSVFMPDITGRLPEFKLEFADPDEINKKLDQIPEFVSAVKSVMSELMSKSAIELVERTHQEFAWDNYKSFILEGEIDLEYIECELQRANIA